MRKSHQAAFGMTVRGALGGALALLKSPGPGLIWLGVTSQKGREELLSVAAFQGRQTGEIVQDEGRHLDTVDLNTSVVTQTWPSLWRREVLERSSWQQTTSTKRTREKMKRNYSGLFFATTAALHQLKPRYVICDLFIINLVYTAGKETRDIVWDSNLDEMKLFEST
ncbi:uncharacterized protein V6R79_004707 [Siganus canaliculatus]